MGYEDHDPEELDDAVLEELLRDDDEHVPRHEPDEHEGEVEDVWSQQPAPAQDDGGGELPVRRELNCPIAPSQHEYDDHCRRGHVQYRDWCPICVQSRGREEPHRRNQRLHVREGVPVVCMDYKTIQKSKPPWLVLREQGSRWITAHQALCNGPQDKWLVERITRDIENIGHSEITLKGNNERAMQQLMTAVKEKRQQQTLVEGPPAVDPQANGAAEKAIQDLMGEARCLKLGLEHRLHARISPDSPIV